MLFAGQKSYKHNGKSFCYFPHHKQSPYLVINKYDYLFGIFCCIRYLKTHTICTRDYFTTANRFWSSSIAIFKPTLFFHHFLSMVLMTCIKKCVAGLHTDASPQISHRKTMSSTTSKIHTVETGL